MLHSASSMARALGNPLAAGFAVPWATNAGSCGSIFSRLMQPFSLLAAHQLPHFGQTSHRREVLCDRDTRPPTSFIHVRKHGATYRTSSLRPLRLRVCLVSLETSSTDAPSAFSRPVFVHRLPDVIGRSRNRRRVAPRDAGNKIWRSSALLHETWHKN